MSSIAPRDVVQLKNGGPRLTVVAVRKDGTALCRWKAGRSLQTRVFRVVSLVLVERRKGA
jgi:uncharacterized protein YodC (DUF2158 family)